RIKQADANADDWFADFAEKYDIESITKAVLNDQAALDELTKTIDAHPVTGEKLTKGRYSAIHLELEDWQRTVKNPIARDYIERLHSALREIFEQAGDQGDYMVTKEGLKPISEIVAENPRGKLPRHFNPD